jgi:hypothetical protein
LLVDGVRWLSTDDCGVVAGRFANCYGLPRYDVARYYPTFPDAPRAGFLFTLDVGTLMNIGVRPGAHNLMVRVGDREQTFAELPNRDGIPVFFQCVDDDFDFLAFGFIDFPTKSDYVGGTVCSAAGRSKIKARSRSWRSSSTACSWARRSTASRVPTSAINIPQINNSNNSGWMFTMDTRKLGNSIHRLTVRTRDTRGRATEIGSTDFYVLNGNPQPSMTVLSSRHSGSNGKSPARAGLFRLIPTLSERSKSKSQVSTGGARASFRAGANLTLRVAQG